MNGKKVWFFPDAEIPPHGGNPEIFGHESVIVLNPGNDDASCEMTLFFVDCEPH